MIYCTIGGRMAYPASGVKIKLSLQNPFIKDEGDHTYEITFPLDIVENRRVFGNVNRIDVSKKKTTYEECRLLSDNKLLVSGTGTVTGITNDSVKLQILGTSSDARMAAEDRYIDELTYPEIESEHKEWCRMNLVSVSEDIITQGYGGVKGRYVFFTVRNDTTGMKYNLIRRVQIGAIQPVVSVCLKRPVLQPNLIYVLQNVIGQLGYTIEENDYDTSPWNELYIINLKRSTTIAGSLPHWKVNTFLKEFCNLFNAVIIYDEPNKKVRIKSYSTISSNSKVSFQPESEFNTEYDEDGVSYIGSDNIAYELRQCGEEKYPRTIPADALKTFTLRHYTTMAEMYAELPSLTERQKMTSIFLCDNTGYSYFRKIDTDPENPDAIDQSPCGFFTTLIKEGNTAGGNTTELRMVPAPIGDVEVRDDELSSLPEDRSIGKCQMPCYEGPDTDADSSEDEEEYMTVQDVLEDEMSIDERGEDDNMFLAFLAEQKMAFKFMDSPWTGYYYVLNSFCDQRESRVPKPWSMCLTEPGSITHYIGAFHRDFTEIDSHNQLVVKFLSTEIPDPKSIFQFYGKLFLCAKIEVEIDENGVDEMKTGYFYEVTG